MRRLASIEFLADALVDEDVGVHGHADRQHDAGDAGHGEDRKLEEAAVLRDVGLSDCGEES